MLTREILVANAALSTLTDEQIAAITNLSQNDENSVIAKKTGEIYGALDADILAVSGIAKNGTEKTYDYAKRVLGEFKGKIETLPKMQSQIDSLTKEKARLEKAIADGTADAETAKALKQAKADLSSITSQFNELNTKYQEAETRHRAEIFGLQVDNELRVASSGLKFKAGLPETVTRVILGQAMEKIKGMNPEMIDDGKGGKILAFKGEDGAIMRNPNNQLNPYTPGELLTSELEKMGVLDMGRKAAGGGTHSPREDGSGGSTVIDISGARNQTEAYDAIASALMAQGIAAGTKEFQSAMNQAWQDNNVKALPTR